MRRPQNRYKAARSFNKKVNRTKAINVANHATRGGYRL